MPLKIIQKKEKFPENPQLPIHESIKIMPQFNPEQQSHATGGPGV
jgi:hypothetical protein